MYILFTPCCFKYPSLKLMVVGFKMYIVIPCTFLIGLSTHKVRCKMLPNYDKVLTKQDSRADVMYRLGHLG